jgi:hypothetical protein
LNGEEPEMVEILRDSLPNVQSLQDVLFSDVMYQMRYSTTSSARHSKVVCYVVPLNQAHSPWKTSSLPGTRLISGNLINYLYMRYNLLVHALKQLL